MTDHTQNSNTEHDIAIVGIAARLTGARNVDEFWRNIRDGVESIQTFTDEQLLAEGESPENLRKPNYVRAGGPLPAMEMFDGEFFGFSPKESAILIPSTVTFWNAPGRRSKTRAIHRNDFADRSASSAAAGWAVTSTSIFVRTGIWSIRSAFFCSGTRATTRTSWSRVSHTCSI